ncbi:MAG: relaxase/mobilization nuclease domain-containing protein [Oscillospiraceae bacterium]|nr:relaxase/mobilization nuclease domain-containing protein [Oscillospiraceae bacterium]
MATTSIWSVKGWLGRVVIYAEDPAKTENPEFFEKKGMTEKQTQNLMDVIDYAVQERKTIEEESPALLRQFVSGVNCRPATAREEMLRTKRLHKKEDGVVAYHGYQSFAPGEVSAGVAHKIGMELAQQLWGERFEVIVATHLDKANHLHNHFIVNTVSFKDGNRYYRSEKDYYNMRSTSDELCRAHGLSVIEQPQKGKTQHRAEWQAEQQGKPTYRSMVKTDVDQAIAQSMTERQFFDNLKRMGYTIKTGKGDITVCPKGRERGLKLMRNLGEDYSIASIRRRILQQQRPARPAPEPTRQVRVFLLRGNFKHRQRMTGFRALYFRYLYLLGKLPKHRPRPPDKVAPVHRGELIKIDQISRELRLLCEHEIDTPEQLAAFKLTASKKEVAICDRIEQRVKDMRTNMKIEKEENKDAIRRSSRTSRENRV